MPLSKKTVALPLIIGLTLAAAVYATSNLGIIEIRGVFEPEAEVSPSRITLDLGRVTEANGSRTFQDVGKLVINTDKDMVKFRLDKQATGITGDLKILVNGMAQVGEQTIQMPCLLSNAFCYRIEALLPGYDAPMEFARGEYPIDITLNWIVVKGSGSISLTLLIESE